MRFRSSVIAVIQPRGSSISLSRPCLFILRDVVFSFHFRSNVSVLMGSIHGDRGHAIARRIEIGNRSLFQEVCL